MVARNPLVHGCDARRLSYTGRAFEIDIIETTKYGIYEKPVPLVPDRRGCCVNWDKSVWDGA